MNKTIKSAITNVLFGTFMMTLVPTVKYPIHFVTKLFHQEKVDLKNDILDDIVKAYNENEISKNKNVAAACGYFSCALASGTISINNDYIYCEDELYDYCYENDYDCLLGKGVCRNANLLLSNLLVRAGFDTTCLVNHFEDGRGHSYIVIFDEENKKYIYDYTNLCFWRFDSLSETVSVPLNSDKTIKSEPYILASLAGVIDFNYNDLFKINNYSNDVDFVNIYVDYLKGINSFTYIDQEKINNLTVDKKEKIKKLEQF